MATQDFDRLKEALSDRYELESEVGHGGMATVFRARDLRHNRQVAVKVIHPELSLAVAGQRFLREIEMAARLQHPNILTLIDSGEAGGLLYYVMPFVDGETLRSRISRDGALPISESMRLLREIVEALAYAHAQGMIHRDIKPENVMIANRHALVLDFGVAKAVDESETKQQHLTTAGHSLGTPAYMAPEQVTADPSMDHRADIYSAGIVAYEMLTGRTPFSGSLQQIMSGHVITAPQKVRAVRAEVPIEVDRIVMKCLEKNPADRYQSAEQLLVELESLITPVSLSATPAQAMSGISSRPVLGAAAVIALIVIGGAIYWLTAGNRRERWVRDEAVPLIRRYTEAAINDSALLIARQAQKIAPSDSLLKSLWPNFSRPLVIATEPAGAKVFYALVNDTSHWELLGTTPTDTLRLPLPPSVLRIRIVKDGFQTVNRLLGTTRPLVLDSANAQTRTMVRIPGGDFIGALPGLDNLPAIPLGDYRIDKYEVTNREYKKFMDGGGYNNPAHWDTTFVLEGKQLTFAEAVNRFKDKTGRPGPATWEAGDFPTGQEDFPVSGLSWYEASAYAKFSGKMLPTVYHWARAATVPFSAYIVPASNFGGQGPRRASAGAALSGYGVADMAGNVREWCYNAMGNTRYILGGGWNDQPYMAIDVNTQDPFDRSVTNGVRLMSLIGAEKNLATALAPVKKGFRDYTREKPASDAEYATFIRLYDYDKRPLNSKVEERKTDPLAVREKITFDAAYGNERMIAYLFLPLNRIPPYQTVVYFPGSNAMHTHTAEGNLETNRVDFLLKSGRAVLYPIYKSTYERQDSLNSDYGDTTIFYRDHVVMWANDMRRSIDYLATRKDIDSNRLAYFGISWGATLGGIMLAVESRLKTGILYVAGLPIEHSRREVDQINFLPRIRVPVIMLNGKYDFFFPVESSQKPFFRLLGTAPQDKKYTIYEGGHFVPRTQLITESLSWLDKYLGPVK